MNHLTERAIAHCKAATLDARLGDMPLLTAFPDADVVFEEWASEGDRYVARFRFDGTHHGEFMGVAPTHKRVSVTGIAMMRFDGDQLVERWSEMDYLGLLHALGVLPFPH